MDDICKQDGLNNALKDLADPSIEMDSETLKKLYYNFREIYEADFRHMYSGIFTALRDIEDDPEKDLEILVNNLRLLNEYVREKCQQLNSQLKDNKYIEDNNRFVQKMNKLFDHVNLDAARISTWRAYESEQEEKLKLIYEDISNSKEALVKVNKEVNSARKKADRSQKEYIAILGIFAAIVTAFMSGSAFSTSVLQNMHKVTAYRLILTVFSLGFVLVNTLYVLFYYLESITKEKELSLKPLKIIDGLILLAVVILIVAWYCGVIEARNTCIMSVNFL